MSTNSPAKLRSGRRLTSSSADNVTRPSNSEFNTNMENNTNSPSEQVQDRSNSLNHEYDSQQNNEERFNHLQDEMSVLKAMIQKLIQQNEERDRQTDASATTSSFTVRASNNREH